MKIQNHEIRLVKVRCYVTLSLKRKDFSAIVNFYHPAPLIFSAELDNLTNSLEIFRAPLLSRAINFFIQ
ncbi:hypothetical protein CXB49_10880 [Chromobacterium sp. ATCC 53434]|nr:hypothetical protein CXB49_10880 [Chromobacterium sp. ATCC 53434]